MRHGRLPRAGKLTSPARSGLVDACRMGDLCPTVDHCEQGEPLIKPSILTAAVVAACLASAAPAAAGVRYASPTGAGSCGNSDPCSLATAVDNAGGNDEVVLYP